MSTGGPGGGEVGGRARHPQRTGAVRAVPSFAARPHLEARPLQQRRGRLPVSACRDAARPRAGGARPVRRLVAADRVVASSRSHTGQRVIGSRSVGGTVVLTLGGPAGQRSDLKVGHVLAATGYRVDLAGLDFMDEAMRRRVRVGRLTAAVRGVRVVGARRLLHRPAVGRHLRPADAVRLRFRFRRATGQPRGRGADPLRQPDVALRMERHSGSDRSRSGRGTRRRWLAAAVPVAVTAAAAIITGRSSTAATTVPRAATIRVTCLDRAIRRRDRCSGPSIPARRAPRSSSRAVRACSPRASSLPGDRTYTGGSTTGTVLKQDGPAAVLAPRSYVAPASARR